MSALCSHSHSQSCSGIPLTGHCAVSTALAPSSSLSKLEGKYRKDRDVGLFCSPLSAVPRTNNLKLLGMGSHLSPFLSIAWFPSFLLPKMCM